MPADTNPYGGVFGGWLMGQMGLACGSFVSRRIKGKALLVAADALKFPGAMAVGDELSVYVELLKEGRTSLRLKAEAIARQRDSDNETIVAEGEFTFVALDDKNQPRPIAAKEEAMADQYDVIVLGSGPGGYVAAIRAAQLGLKTAIVERELLGGICLNWGCIPTKALLSTAEVFHYMQHADAYGLSNEKPSFDIAKVVARSRAVAKQLNQGVAHLMKKNKITVVMGEGKLTAKTKLQRHRRGRKDDRAQRQAHHRRDRRPGARPSVRQGRRQTHLDLSPRDDPAEMPTELLVIGSGAIGIEFASFYADLGAKVTVVEMLDRVVPVEDAEVSDQLAKSLQKQGLTILTCAGVESLKTDAKGVTAKIKTSDGKINEQRFSHCIVAVGIVPNTENIGLEALGVKTTKGHIDTDPMCRTNVPGIWAIGDVTAPPWLAHKASHEGVTAAEAIAKELGNKDVHPAPDRPEEHSGLHLLPPAGRERRPHRGCRPRKRATRSRSASSRRSATARRSRSARSRAS